MKKKVYLSNDNVPWEHEEFSKKKIIAGTISTLAKPFESCFNRTIMTDIVLDKQVLMKNIKFIAESLLAFMFDYNVDKFAIFKEDENFIDEQNVDSLVQYFSKVSRFPLAIEKGSKFNNDMFMYLNTYLKEAKRMTFEYNEMKFYENNSGDVKVYSVKAKTIDLYLLVIIFVYLLVIYVYTKGVKEFFVGVKNTFSSDE